MAKMDDITGGEITIAGRKYTMEEMKLNGAVIWPLNYTYVIVASTIRVRYADGTSIKADASNWAYLTATVQTLRGGVVVSEAEEVLTINAVSDSRFWIGDQRNIFARHLDSNNKGMGTISFPQGITFTVTSYGAHGITVTNNPITVTQEPNVITNQQNEKVYKRYAITLSSEELTNTGGQVNVTSTAYYDQTPVYTWTSGCTSRGQTTSNNPEAVTPATLTVSPSSGVTIRNNNSQILFPANTTQGDIRYTVSASWNGFNAPNKYVTVKAVTYTYQAPVVTIAYALKGTTWHLGAAADSIYPTISFTQRRSDGVDITGTLTGGATSGTASDGSAFSLGSVNGQTYHSASLYATTGRIAVNSRGVTAGDEWVVAQNIVAAISCHNLSGVSTGSVVVRQRENRANAVAAEYSSVRIASLFPASVSSAAPTSVMATVRATWKDAGTKFTAYEDGDTGAFVGMTQHTDESVTAAEIEVNSSDRYYNTNSFSVGNKYNLSAKQHSVRAKYGTAWSDSVSLTQAADYKRATSDVVKSQYGVSLTKSNDTVSAAGGGATLSWAAWHYEAVRYVWNSDGSDAGTGTPSRVDDPASKAVISVYSGGTRFHRNGTSVTHDNMGTNETTDSVTYMATHQDDATATATVSFNATNSKGSGVHSYGDKVYGTQTTDYDNSSYELSLSLSQYASSISAAPFEGGIFNVLVLTATHRERTATPWTQAHYITYTYTSGATSVEQGTPNTGTDYGEYTTATDTPSLSTNQTWLSASGTLVTAQANTGLARNGRITATVTRANGTTLSKYVTFYQQKYVRLEVSPASLVFTSMPGTLTFTVIYTNTRFTLSHSGQGTADPVIALSHTSGGNVSGSGTVTVTVTVGRNTGSSNLFSEIKISPSETSVLEQFIDVLQQPENVSMGYHGYADATWETNSRIKYSWYIRNNNSGSVRFTPTLYIYYTTSASQSPAEGTLLRQIPQSQVYVQGNSVSDIVEGTITGVSRNSSYLYWVRIVAPNLTSSFTPFEEEIDTQ